MDDSSDDCPHVQTCPMFGLFQRSGTLGLWKLSYCQGNYAECARFKLGVEGRRVPSTLLPNGRELPRVAGQ